MLLRSGRTIGLDIGGTKIAGGVIDGNGQVIERLTPVPTPSGSQEAVVGSLRDLTSTLRRRCPDVEAIGIGAPGLVEWPQGSIRWAPNNAFRNLPLRKLLSDETGLPTVVDNDANAAAWAESVSSDRTHVALLTVGTGVGGGLILDGRLYRGKTGIAGEVGHMIVDPNGGQRCSCGNVGCLEAMASGTALGRLGREAAAADADGLIARISGGPEHVTGETVHQAALVGDPTGLRLFDRVGYWLGVGIATLVNLLDFELVIIGGGLVETGGLLLDPARASFKRFLFAAPHRDVPQIVAASLGVDAGWIGAALLAREVGIGDADETAGEVDRS